MKRRKIFLIEREKLESLSTKRLLARLKTLQRCEQSFDLSDRDESERSLKTDYIEFKESVEWQSEYAKVKEILNKREHIS